MTKRKAEKFIASDDEDDKHFEMSETEQSADSDEQKKPKSRKVHLMTERTVWSCANPLYTEEQSCN
jgi:hypothetical protein